MIHGIVNKEPVVGQKNTCEALENSESRDRKIKKKMESAKVPKQLVLTGNLSENFRRFKQNFGIYMKAAGLTDQDSETRVNILLNVMGEDAIELFNTLNLTVDQQKDYDVVLKAFEDYMSPRKNVVMERFTFANRVQEEGEGFDSFLTDLKKLSQSCEFGDQQQSFIRDRIVYAIRDKDLQERLLRVNGLTLEKATDLCKAAEISRLQAEALQGKNKEIYAVRPKQEITVAGSEPNTKKKYHSEPRKERKPFGESKRSYYCKKCCQNHEFAKCPAFRKTCLKCGEWNHFAVACRLKKVRNIGRGQQEESEDTDSDVGISALTVVKELVTNNKDCKINSMKYNNATNSKSPTEWIQEISVGPETFQCKLDTGAEVSVLPMGLVKKIKMVNDMKQTGMCLEAYGGTRVKAQGTVRLRCKIPGRKNCKEIKFVVVEETGRPLKPLIGLADCIQLGLVKRIDALGDQNRKEKFIREYADQFKGQGTFKMKCKIKIQPHSVPVVKSPRRIPVAIKDRLKRTLSDLQKRGVIIKVDQPDGWVSNLVVVEKSDGTLRCCLDPHELNKVIVREHCLIPTLDDITPILANKVAYTVLDLKDGFWHIKLDNESSKLCTFTTPFGCYRFTRMPFGITTAPEVFQKLNQNNFGDIDGTVIYFDDILIAGDTLEEHDKILKKVMCRAKELNVKFNVNKVQYRVPEVKYLGQVFSQEGVRPDPARVQAIQDLKSPKNRKELQKVMGTVNYLRQYISNMSVLTAPFRELLKKNTEWQWLQKHEETFEELKKRISHAPTIKMYDRRLPLKIQADSSKDGLGCCLQQEDRPLAFASRSLTPTEVNYSQIEKELLAITFAVKKFHHFIYGKPVKVVTDHKPLLAIMKKEIHKIVSSRLQRMRLKLVKYNLNLEFCPGRLLHVADLLSRNYVKGPQEEDQEMLEVVHTVSRALHITDEKRSEFKKQTEKDPILEKVMKYHREGWPRKGKDVPKEVWGYKKLGNELIVEEGLLFLGEKVVVPNSLRKEMLKLLHQAHFGIEKTKRKARQIMYWPGMSMDIVKLINQCGVCAKYSKNNTKEPIIRHQLPEIPFEMVGLDLCEWGNQSYLVLVCYLTKWLEVRKLRDKSIESVIDALMDIFSTHGVPKTVVADNVPFNCHRFSRFARERDFERVYSSPYYPRSNGMAEKMVGIAKGIIKKANEEGKDYRMALLEYRTTPLIGLSVSPAQLLMSRRLRTGIPIAKRLYTPQVQSKYRTVMQQIREKQSEHYNRTARSRPELKEGDDLVYRKSNTWEPARILRPHGAPRSYIIQDQRGKELRRNKIHLKKTDMKFKLSLKGEEHPLVEAGEPVQEDCVGEAAPHGEEERTGGDGKRTRSGRLVKRPGWFDDYVQ